MVAIALLSLILIGSGALAAVENWESFSEPPGIFQFPANYTVGFQFVSDTSPTGGILTIPFGNNGERTPWGGVSVSSELVAGVESGHDTEIFEAGTPSSLSIDQFIGNGTTFGLTNNVSKILSELNVQYVVTTDYPNWSYASDPIYDPVSSYVGFGQQVGFGHPVFRGGYQTVYAVPGPVGNISIYRSYSIYFGGPSLLYELLNEPWFNASLALVNGFQVSGQILQPLASHATALITSTQALASIPTEVLHAAEVGSVPVVVLAGESDASPGSATSAQNLWNASNGVEFFPATSNSTVLFDSDLPALSEAGYTTYSAQVRAQCPPSALLALSLNGQEVSNGTPGPLDSQPFPYWSANIVSAGINNGGRYPYNGSVSFVNQSGTQLLNWSFAGHNTTYQYLNFNVHSLAGLSGLEFNATNVSSGPLTFLMQVIINGTYANLRSYVPAQDQPAGQTTYAFYLPSATGPGATELRSNPGSVTRFSIGLTSTGNFHHLNLSNFTSFVSPSSPGFVEVPLGSLAAGPAAVLGLKDSGGCAIDTVTLIASTEPLQIRYGAAQVDLSTQASPTALSVTAQAGGWGIVQIAQTYSSGWALSGNLAGDPHFPVNLGLNGWLVDLGEGQTVRAIFRPSEYVSAALIVSTASVPVMGLFWWSLSRPSRTHHRPGRPKVGSLGGE